MKKISVIVPVYNAEKYLEKCLDSLVNQTLKDIEIIVVNDGSTDGSEKILSKYKNKIKIIHQKNSGVASARNNGMSVARGEYIAFVDSDDWVDKDMFLKLYQKAKANDMDVVECNFKYVFNNYEKNGVIDLKNDINNYDNIKKYFVNMFPVIWNKIYKKDILKNITFKDGVWAEDVEFLYRILPNIKTIGIISDKLYYYYQREMSESRHFDKRIYNYIDNFNGIVEYYKESNLYDKYYKELEYCYVRYIYATFIKSATKFDTKEFNRAVKKATLNVKKNFPKYRKNKYFYRNLKGIYLVLFNKFLAHLVYFFENRKKEI